jgi:hypothetical protein
MSTPLRSLAARVSSQPISATCRVASSPPQALEHLVPRQSEHEVEHDERRALAPRLLDRVACRWPAPVATR